MVEWVAATPGRSRDALATTNAIFGIRRRGRRVTWLLLILASGLAVAAVAAPAASARVPRSFYGTVAATPLTQSDFNRMDGAGVGTLRLEFNWPAIQPKHRGPLNWGGIDKAVAAAAWRGISVLPVLIGTPRYEAHRCKSHDCGSGHIRFKTRSQRRDWQAFVRAAVRRYGRNGDFWSANKPYFPYEPITRWQIWNEQNNPTERDPAGLYAKLLKSADKTIHAIDSRAQTVLGGMFGTPPGGTKTTAWSYLGSLYKAGAGKHFDAVALHPYSPTISGIRTQIKRMRRVLRRHHDSSRQILVTEIGWGSSRTRHADTGLRGAVFNVSARQQKRKLARSFGLLTNNRRSWRIGGVYWFQWRDPRHPPPGLCAFCYSAGLYRADGKTAKPALSAFKRFTRNTRG
jgi:hypothetical protein